MKTRTKNILRQSIRLILSGSMLMTGAADAVLMDHGPQDPNITFPQWYRDEEGLALGLCRSTSAFCFPLTANPDGYPGNIGDEVFYNLVEFKGTAAQTGSDFEYRYLGALEASYLPGPKPTRGEETVFSRIRITFNFNDTNKEGDYTVIHPLGVHTFTDVKATAKTNLIGAQASNFFTIDVPFGTGFEGALGGYVGPFIKWDTGLPITSGNEQFVGDPAIAHTFTGSPFLDDQQNPQNYLTIIGPAGSNLDGKNLNPVIGVRTAHDTIHVTEGFVLGQIWTQAIPSPLKINAAALTRTASKNGIDVWATSAANARLVVTGQGMPSKQLTETSTNSTIAAFPVAKYHAHIEYPQTSPVTATPAQIKVTNLTSNPLINATTGLTDVVKIKQASFDTLTREITVVAQSSDQVANPRLVVEGINGVPSTLPLVSNELSTCVNIASATETADKCFTYTLPASIEPPEKITVISGDAGAHTDQSISIIGKGQNPEPAITAADINLVVDSTGITNINLPLDAIVIQQPINGVVSLVNGQWVFKANPGLSDNSTDSFKFIIKQLANVSNVATAQVTINFVASTATAAADYYPIEKNTTRNFKVLANDKAATVNLADQLNVASVAIKTSPQNGVAIVNSDGSIDYTAGSTLGVDTFTYTVETTAGKISAPTTVTVTNFSAPESIGVIKSVYTGRAWQIQGTDSWFGNSLPNQTVTCYNGTSTNPLPAVIGTSIVDNLGNFQIPGLAEPVGIVGSTIACQSISGARAASPVQ